MERAGPAVRILVTSTSRRSRPNSGSPRTTYIDTLVTGLSPGESVGVSGLIRRGSIAGAQFDRRGVELSNCNTTISSYELPRWRPLDEEEEGVKERGSR